MLQTSLDKVTYADVRAFLDERLREHTELEYKEPQYDQGDKFEFDTKFLQTIAAFANSDGGLLVCGVREERSTSQPGEVVGIRTVSRKTGRRRDPVTILRDRCATEIEPRLSLEAVSVAIPAGEEGEGTELLLIRVRPGPLPPYFLRDHGIYVRQDEADRLATVREIEALLDRRPTTEGRVVAPWAQANNDVFAYARSGQPGQHLYTMLWLTPAFPIAPVPMDGDTDRQFQRLLAPWFAADRYVVSLPTGIVYSPSLSPEVVSTNHLTAGYACAYEDGTIAMRWLLAERPEQISTSLPPLRLNVPEVWKLLRKQLLALCAWPYQTCGYGGSLRCRLGLADVTGAVIGEVPPMVSQELPAILNRLVGWESVGEWRDTDDLEDFLDSAMASLARQLQCRWYAGSRHAVRTAALQ